MNFKTFVIKIPPPTKKGQKTKTRGSIRFTKAARLMFDPIKKKKKNQKVTVVIY